MQLLEPNFNDTQWLSKDRLRVMSPLYLPGPGTGINAALILTAAFMDMLKMFLLLFACFLLLFCFVFFWGGVVFFFFFFFGGGRIGFFLIVFFFLFCFDKLLLKKSLI